jgi:cell wall-associated NlpC family hydrolase
MDDRVSEGHVMCTSRVTTAICRGIGPLILLAVMLAAAPDARLAAADGQYTYTRLDDPPRTVVTDARGAWLATFTDGAYTVTLLGPSRTFSEPTAAHPVVTTTWVRVLPAPFAGTMDAVWLANELADTGPDIFALAMQYRHDAPPVADGNGVQIAGSALYGPELPNGRREEGADFSDYLGVPWTFGDHKDKPDPRAFRSLDCSGFMRMVWGYRAGLPLGYLPDGMTLPRHSWELLERAPGTVLIPNTGAQVADFTRLAPGDLVFFKWDPDNAHPIDHVGMYLGPDTAGRLRFISSRQGSDGPTMGDTRGASLLDGMGLWARAFRGARRL